MKTQEQIEKRKAEYIKMMKEDDPETQRIAAQRIVELEWVLKDEDE